ncbi:MAG: hypothetical protein ACOZHQ_09310 [Thermodesulfobacteriota bacterium]
MDRPGVDCKHFEIIGSVTQYGACRVRRSGCVSCCILCGLRLPEERVGGSGQKYMTLGCKRACFGPEKE